MIDRNVLLPLAFATKDTRQYEVPDAVALERQRELTVRVVDGLEPREERAESLPDLGAAA